MMACPVSASGNIPERWPRRRSLVVTPPLCSSLVCDEACHGLGPPRHRSYRVLWVRGKRFTAAEAPEPTDRPRPFGWRHPVGRAAEKRREGIRTRQVKASWSRLVLRRPNARRLLVPGWTGDGERGY